jgi:hypothetical protein
LSETCHLHFIAKLTTLFSRAASKDVLLHFRTGNYLSLLSKSYVATWIALNLCGRRKMKRLSPPALMYVPACGLLRRFILQYSIRDQHPCCTASIVYLHMLSYLNNPDVILTPSPSTRTPRSYTTSSLIEFSSSFAALTFA